MYSTVVVRPLAALYLFQETDTEHNLKQLNCPFLKSIYPEITHPLCITHYAGSKYEPVLDPIDSLKIVNEFPEPSPTGANIALANV
jgi:hypothetical protein